MEEGGLGFKSMIDVPNALFCKLWWNLRTKPSQWTAYMLNKYCKKLHPEIAQSKYGSPVWKKMIMVRDLVEHHIWWQVRNGNSSFWYDNWTTLGALINITTDGVHEEIEVKEFADENGWNRDKLTQILSHEVVSHIIQNIPCLIETEIIDNSWWMEETNGKFTVKSAWNYIRHRGANEQLFNNMWTKGLTFKISFLLWRAWMARIPTDDIIQKMGINMVSKCWCCTEHQRETINHIFLTAPIAQKVWRLFSNCAGIENRLQLSEIVIKWWTYPCKAKIRPLMTSMPVIIMWEI